MIHKTAGAMIRKPAGRMICKAAGAKKQDPQAGPGVDERTRVVVETAQNALAGEQFSALCDGQSFRMDRPVIAARLIIQIVIHIVGMVRITADMENVVF